MIIKGVGNTFYLSKGGASSKNLGGPVVMCWNFISGAEGSGIIEEFRYPGIWKEFQYCLISLIGILGANGFGHGLRTPNEGICKSKKSENLG